MVFAHAFPKTILSIACKHQQLTRFKQEVKVNLSIEQTLIVKEGKTLISIDAIVANMMCKRMDSCKYGFIYYTDSLNQYTKMHC